MSSFPEYNATRRAGPVTAWAVALVSSLRRVPIPVHIVNHLGVVVASKFIPVASIFLYSRFMPVQDYGVINLFASYLWIFAIVMSLNLHTGIGRYIYTEDADFGGFLGTCLLSIGAIFAATAALLLLNLGAGSTLLGLPRGVIVLIPVVVLGQIAESLFTQVAVFHQRSALLLKVVAGKALATFAVSLGLLLWMRSDKYLAVLYGDALASVGLVAYVMAGFRRTVRWSFRVDHLRYMSRYSLPLIPYMLSLTLLSQFDRVLIDRFFGKEATGLYSLAYNIGVLLLMVVTALLNTFNPGFFDALNKKDHDRVVKDSDSIFALAVLVTAILVLFGQDLARLVVPDRYGAALDLIPAVAIGGLCFVIFHIWVRVIAFANRTYLISAIAILSTAVNVGLNYWLLPTYGYKIAAVTTIIAYLVMSLLCVAVVNHVVGLFRVSVVADLAYVAALGGATLAFRAVDLPSTATQVIKAVLCVLLLWHLKPKLVALVRSRMAGLTSSAA